MLYKFISISGNSIMSKSSFRGVRRRGQPPPGRGSAGVTGSPCVY